MKISVMGAGAVGSYYGAMLVQAGHDVTFIGRPAQVAALREHGLLVEKGGSVTRLDVQASAEPSAVASSDIVIFSVKSSDTEAAAKAMAPFSKRRGEPRAVAAASAPDRHCHRGLCRHGYGGT
jgi:2-dehydropantoate 2-reductase